MSNLLFRSNSFINKCIKSKKITINAQNIQCKSYSKSEFNIVGTLLTEKDLKVGLYAELQHTFTQENVNKFANICGDNNPLHIDPNYAKNTIFEGTIVHGILVSSLFSTLFGRSISGSIYVSQNLSFKNPVHVGVPIIARMEINTIEDKRKGRLMNCITTCHLIDGSLAVNGEAKVLLPF